MKARIQAVEFIVKQLTYETEASSNKSQHHYGREELKELLDFIYEGKPETEEEKISCKFYFSTRKESE